MVALALGALGAWAWPAEGPAPGVTSTDGPANGAEAPGLPAPAAPAPPEAPASVEVEGGDELGARPETPSASTRPRNPVFDIAANVTLGGILKAPAGDEAWRRRAREWLQMYPWHSERLKIARWLHEGGEPLSVVALPGGQTHEDAGSPRGAVFLGGSQRALCFDAHAPVVRVVDASTGVPQGTLELGLSPSALVASPDGDQLLVAGWAARGVEWLTLDVADDAVALVSSLRTSLPSPPDAPWLDDLGRAERVTAMAYDPPRRRLAVAVSGRQQVFLYRVDWATRELVWERERDGVSARVHELAVSSQGHLGAAYFNGGDGVRRPIARVESADGERRWEHHAHELFSAYFVSFRDDGGQLALGTKSGELLWLKEIALDAEPVALGQPVADPRGLKPSTRAHPSWTTGGAFSTDGAWLYSAAGDYMTAGASGELAVWDLRAGAPTEPARRISRPAAFRSLVRSTDGERLLLFRADCHVEVWDARALRAE